MRHAMIAILTLLVMLLAFSLACADQETALPPEILTILTTGSMEGASVLDAARLTGYGNDDCLFAAVRTSGGTNWLYCFRQQADGTWRRQFRTSGAIPQTANRIEINLATGGEEWPSDDVITAPTLFILRIDAGDEYPEMCVSYRLENHKWLLRRIWSYTGYDHMRFGEGAITYYRDIESPQIAGVAEGTVQRDIRYVRLQAIPRNLAEARTRLTVAPALPDSAELRAWPVTFTGAQRYDVYSAPGETSVRGANGKASVSTNAWIQVFGTEGEWVLVHYSIDASHYRFGYIRASALPRGASVPALAFTPGAAWTTSAVDLTDDPLYSRSPLLRLPDGVQVTWLATMGDWAYVEVARNDWARGFVPLSCLSHGRVLDLRNQPDGNGNPVFEGTLTVTHDDRVEISAAPAPDGPLARQSVAEIRVTDGMSGDLLMILTPASDGRFYGNCGLGGDVSSVSLEAVDADGMTTAAIRVDW